MMHEISGPIYDLVKETRQLDWVSTASFKLDDVTYTISIKEFLIETVDAVDICVYDELQNLCAFKNIQQDSKYKLIGIIGNAIIKRFCLETCGPDAIIISYPKEIEDYSKEIYGQINSKIRRQSLYHMSVQYDNEKLAVYKNKASAPILLKYLGIPNEAL
jgi:hypothetical protein